MSKRRPRDQSFNINEERRRLTKLRDHHARLVKHYDEKLAALPIEREGFEHYVTHVIYPHNAPCEFKDEDGNFHVLAGGGQRNVARNLYILAEYRKGTPAATILRAVNSRPEWVPLGDVGTLRNVLTRFCRRNRIEDIPTLK